MIVAAKRDPEKVSSGLSVAAVALGLADAGNSVIPIPPDGTKRPAVRAWKSYQHERPSPEQIKRWFGMEPLPGIAVIGGAVSGGRETLDFDDGNLFRPWSELVEAQAPGLTRHLTIIQTPRDPPGFHVPYRCLNIAIPGSKVLARRERLTLIETRGEGGYAIVPGGNPDAHPSGKPYVHLAGPPLTAIPVLSPKERSLLWDAAKSFDIPRQLSARPDPRPLRRSLAVDGKLLPGEEFDQCGPDWLEILSPHGWQLVYQKNDVLYLKRPGKTAPGISATAGYCRGRQGEPLLRVFSSNAWPFEEGKCYGKFRTFALLGHRGDLRATARVLRFQGYGDATHKDENKSGNSITVIKGNTGEGFLPLSSFILMPLLEEAKLVKCPTEAEGLNPVEVRTLASLCVILQRQAGHAPFPLSCRATAELFGVHYSSASRWLLRLEKVGIITRVSTGRWTSAEKKKAEGRTKDKANEYRCLVTADDPAPIAA
jgi:hypothetical protein